MPGQSGLHTPGTEYYFIIISIIIIIINLQYKS